MIYIIHLLTILNLLDIVIVIGVKTSNFERVLLALLFHGRCRIYLVLKEATYCDTLNLWNGICFGNIVNVMQFGSKICWRRLIFHKKNQQKSVDKKSIIALLKNSISHNWSKHIDRRYHFIRECIMKKEEQLKFVKFQGQIVDIFTKCIKFEDFRRLRMLIGVTNQV